MISTAVGADDTPPTASIGGGTGKLSGAIFEDANKNGVLDEGEAPAANIFVSLLGENSEVLASVSTDDAGNYEFSDLKEGVYTLRFEFTPDFVVRSTGVMVGDGKVITFVVPVITPDSRYDFVRLRLVNPATVKTSDPVSPFRP